ncbi:PHP domain-containing protein [Millisia brevis]|uniref:PHP domain-containing protein n=1 Tax=Millisia brevis TaxID=264148 RepID=UPI00083494C2|nr:PHP domain-containing protein [Millisia brevis]
MSTESLDPVVALREVAFWLERSRNPTRRVQAYRKAADIIGALPDAQRQRIAATDDWQSLKGVGPKTAAVARQAAGGAVPDYLLELREAAAPIGSVDGLRAALRGDLHTHSNWSDGGSPIEEMMLTARRLGHEYCALTDHSPRLTVANGLDADRLRRQLDVIDELREQVAPLRILTGIEVDILADGSLDQTDELLDRLDIVVASVHSSLRDDRDTMTRRMLAAVRHPTVSVLGHCTGRLVEGDRGTRPPSVFDADAAFAACAEAGTAVEINSRPERRDPPGPLLEQALAAGCMFSIDTDAHAPGQLDWQGYGCERAERHGVTADRVINTLPADDLLAWCAGDR